MKEPQNKTCDPVGYITLLPTILEVRKGSLQKLKRLVSFESHRAKTHSAFKQKAKENPHGRASILPYCHHIIRLHIFGSFLDLAAQYVKATTRPSRMHMSETSSIELNWHNGSMTSRTRWRSKSRRWSSLTFE